MTHFTVHNDKKIAYSVFGNGFPIVFVHGFCEDRSMWKKFIKPFTEKHSVITIDIGGFGETELPNEPTIHAMAQQVNAVLAAEQIERCILVGHSMGGYVSLAFAQQYGDKLQGLCMFHTHPFGDTAEKKINRDKGIEFVKTHGSEKYVRSMLPMLFAPFFRVEFKMVVQELIFAAQKFNADTIINGLQAMKNRKNNADVLEKIDCPVQFIIGKKDVSVSWQQSLRQAALPRVADIRIFENVGHMGMFEAKEETQQALLEFVKMCQHR